MIKFFRKQMNKKGFTLIELIVVIAILGILAAIAVPRLGGVRAGAEVKADQATGRTIASAVSLYEANTGTGPVNIAALIPEYLDVNPKSAVTPTSSFFINDVSSGDALKVYVGTDATGTQVYPKP